MSRSAGGDLLSAASLLLALLTFLYGLAYPRLTSATRVSLAGRRPEDVGRDRRDVAAARRTALLVASAAGVVAAVFAPETAVLVWRFVARLDEGGAALASYDAVATSFVLVNAGALLLGLHALLLVRRITGVLRDLGPHR